MLSKTSWTGRRSRSGKDNEKEEQKDEEEEESEKEAKKLVCSGGKRRRRRRRRRRSWRRRWRNLDELIDVWGLEKWSMSSEAEDEADGRNHLPQPLGPALGQALGQAFRSRTMQVMQVRKETSVSNGVLWGWSQHHLIPTRIERERLRQDFILGWNSVSAVIIQIYMFFMAGHFPRICSAFNGNGHFTYSRNKDNVWESFLANLVYWLAQEESEGDGEKGGRNTQ